MKYFYFVLILTFAVACEKPLVLAMVDNPGPNPITVQFDQDEVIQLNPYEFKRLRIRTGNRILKLNGVKVGNVYFDSHAEYLVNPLKEKYYVESRDYTVRLFSQEELAEEKITTMIDGIEVPGDFQRVDDLIIKKFWHVDIDKEFPRHAKRSGNGMNTTGRKIYRDVELKFAIQDYLNALSKEHD